jgi:hypothetical protein
LRKENSARAALSGLGTPLEQRHLYLCGNGPPERRSSGVLKPRWRNSENPAPERNPRLERTQMSAIFKKFNVKTNFEIKINVIRKYLRYIQQNHQ